MLHGEADAVEVRLGKKVGKELNGVRERLTGKQCCA